MAAIVEVLHLLSLIFFDIVLIGIVFIDYVYIGLAWIFWLRWIKFNDKILATIKQICKNVSTCSALVTTFSSVSFLLPLFSPWNDCWPKFIKLTATADVNATWRDFFMAGFFIIISLSTVLFSFSSLIFLFFAFVSLVFSAFFRCHSSGAGFRTSFPEPGYFKTCFPSGRSWAVLPMWVIQNCVIVWFVPAINFLRFSSST